MNGSPGWFWNIIRDFFTALDSFGYWVLSGVYKIFFAVSSAEIISGDVVTLFFSRVQWILGIIMVFKLAFTALNIIVNPDFATDKQKGTGKIITRIAAALFMLTLIVPISNIPDDEAVGLNGKIKDHGILFGFLYQFQESMMYENILGKLILGSNAGYNVSDSNGSMNAGGEIDNMSDIGNIMAATVAKSFIYPTILSSADENEVKSTADLNDNVAACAGNGSVNYYRGDRASYSGILSYINDTCNSEDGEVYAFHYTILGGLICSIIMTIIIVGFTIDVAVRAIKLAVLRLIAPVPIISYISPGSEKDGAFGNWVKTLVSTYIDLFVRLAIIYFGAYLIILVSKSLGSDGVNIIQTGYGFVTNFLATIFIIIGILVFMKQAPKFLKDLLGIKGAPMGNAGLSGILGGAAMAIGGGGLAGFGLGALQGMQASADAQAQGKPFTPFQSWAQNRDMMAKIRTGDKDAHGGIIGRSIDRLNFDARERRADRLGISRNNFANAKYNKDLREAEAAAAQQRLDFAKQRLSGLVNPGAMMSQEEFWNSTAGLTSENLDEKYAEYQENYNRQNSAWQRAMAEYTEAYQENASAQQRYQKASKLYDSIDKDRANMGVAPRIIDVRTETYRSNRAVRTNDAGQTINSRGEVTSDSDQFVYETDTKSYDGTVDDSTVGSMHHGAGRGGGH